MKKLQFTLLLVLVCAISAMAQIPYKNVPLQRTLAELNSYKQNRFKPIVQKNHTDKGTPTTSMYIDYDALSALTTANTKGYVWEFNSNAKPTNVSDSFMITKCGMALAYSLNADSIVGFTDYADVNGSALYFKYPTSITIDTIYSIFTHENNSGLADTLGYQINELTVSGANSSINVNNVLYSDQDTTMTTLSSGGNYLGTGALTEIDWAPNYTTSLKTAIQQIYKAPRIDSFGVIFNFLENTANGDCLAPSTFPTSFNNFIPFINNFARSAGITAGGAPYYFQDWYSIVKITFQEPLSGSFTNTPNSPSVNTSASFVGSSNDPSATYSWNFGDGSATGTGKNTSHVYTTPGTYVVDLTISNATDNILISKSIVVQIGGGINAINNFNIGKISPNPAKVNSTLNIPVELFTATNKATINVFNTLGQNELSSVEVVNNNIQINTVGLSEGIHFYSIEIGGQKVSGKFTLVK